MLIQSSVPTVTATVTTTNLVDAEPMSHPPSELPTPLPGFFSVRLEQAEMHNQCLPDPEQKQAWDCTSGAIMYLSVNPVDVKPQVRFTYKDDGPSDETLSTVRFGAQPPTFNVDTSMSLVNHMDKGPAYLFHQHFDKLIILPEDTFRPTESALQRRGDELTDPEYPVKPSFESAVYAKVGHKPWYCYWNATLIEGFIFVTSKWLTPASSPATSEDDLTTDDSAGGSDSSTTPSKYPMVMKIEERLDVGHESQPYCQQMLIMGDRSVQSNDLPRFDLLEETVEVTSGGSKKREDRFRYLSNFGKRWEQSTCRCAWMLDGS
jgi:hypothetical protein